MEIAQVIMVITLILMISGRVPIYLTAVIGSSLAAMVAGFPFGGKAETTIVKMINSGLHPVIADMVGVLVFIGIMEKAGYLNTIIVKIMEAGKRLGGGPGVCTAGGIAAGIIGALTGFTQPAITAVITGPAAVKLGVNPSKAAGVQAHAGNFGNFAGFTHPTMVAIIATAGIGFGMINVIGAVSTLAIFALSFYRLYKEANAKQMDISDSAFNEMAATFSGSNETSLGKAIFPFVILVLGFALGYPILLVGVLASILVAFLAKMPLIEGESAMMTGVNRIATPLFATIAFLFMSTVINKVGLVSLLSNWFAPYLKVAPIQIMLLVSALTGLVTQSNAASAAIVVPFLQIVLQAGVDPFAAAVAAVGGCAIMQYFLTGGPVSALATVIPVIPGSELKAANRFQRPSILLGLFITFIFTFFI